MTHHITWLQIFNGFILLVTLALTVVWFCYVSELTRAAIKYLRTKAEADKPKRSDLKRWFINTLVLAKCLLLTYHMYQIPIQAFIAHLKA